ncbi:MAG: transporter, partial [Ramlibacter sp.]|nr:transporter [Ramlibacter sp.]
MIRQTIARRTLLAAGVAFAATLAVPHAVAQEAAFPTGPVRIVLPFPPGTVNDTIIRILAERLSVQWKQPVTIDNRPGASSMIGTANVAQSKP